MGGAGSNLTVRAQLHGQPLGEAPLPDYALEPLASDLFWRYSPYVAGVEVEGAVAGLVRADGAGDRAVALFAALREPSTGRELAGFPYPITAQCISRAVADLFNGRASNGGSATEPAPVLTYELNLNGAPRPASARLLVTDSRRGWRFRQPLEGERVQDLIPRADVYGSYQLGHPLVFLTQDVFEALRAHMVEHADREGVAGLMGRTLLDSEARMPYVLVERLEPLVEGVESTPTSVLARPDAVGPLLGGSGRHLCGLAHSHPGLSPEMMYCATLSPVDHDTLRKRLRRAFQFSMIVNVGRDRSCTWAAFGWKPGSGDIGGIGAFFVLRPGRHVTQSKKGG